MYKIMEWYEIFVYNVSKYRSESIIFFQISDLSMQIDSYQKIYD